MPRRTVVNIKKAEEFAFFDKLYVSLGWLKNKMNSGEQLIFEESLFSDPGEDYTALYLGKKRVGYWPGY